MSIIGICRFSLLGRGDWKVFFGQPDDQLDAIVAEQAKILFAPERMETRFNTFEHLTLASVKAQTDPDFKFLVLSSELMPKPYQDRLRALCADIPQVELHFFPVTTVRDAQRIAFKNIGVRYPEVLQFRLDDDDCVCADFIELMKAHTRELMAGPDIFAASVEGVLYSAVGGRIAGVYDWPIAFMSAGAALRHPTRSIYDFGHFKMGQNLPSVVIPGRLSLVTHNGANDTQFTPMTIKRRGMRLMNPDEVRQAVAANFPFLSEQGQKASGVQPVTEEPPPDEPPGPHWLHDLASTKYHKGFFISEDQFALQHTFRTSKVLYVSFDNLSSVRADSRLRDPWGYDFAARSEWSSLGVLCYRPNWFRIPRLAAELQRLSEQGFFEKFQKVVFCGTSMGAYAACAYSSLVPGSTVVAFSPQSTLERGVADWDTRYPTGSAADWSGPFSDAAHELKSAAQAWIVYDPRIAEDRQHAERLAGPNVTLLRARHSSHFTAQYLRQIGVLSKFSRECVAGQMTEARFYALYRTGRTYRRYLDGVVNLALSHPSVGLRRRLSAVLRKDNKPGLAAKLDRRVLPETGED